MLIKINDGVPELTTLNILKREYPNVSFSESVSEDILAEYDVYPCSSGEVLQATNRTYVVKDELPEQGSDGQWVWGWSLRDIPSGRKEAEVRKERDELLTTLVDPLVSNPFRWADLTTEKQSEYTTYRTNLLNVTTQEGFPFSVMWPTEPRE